MANLLGTDEFLVNRNDVTYTQQQETLMASIQDTDHLLINRAGQTYKITGEDLINSVVDPLEITVVLAPADAYTSTPVTAVPVVSGGKQPDGGFVFTYQWVTATDGAGTNKANIAGANAATFTPDNAQVGLFLGCVVSTTDALGTTAEGEAYIGPIQVLAQAPVIADIAISEIYDGQNRFTDKEFPYVTTMAVDGEPDPTYEVKAKLSGTTFDFDVLSDVITDVEGGGIATCETDLIESVDSVRTDTHYDQQMTASASTNVIADPNTITGWIDTTLNDTNLTGDASVIFARFSNPTVAVFSKITAGCGAGATHYLVYWDDNTSEWVVDTKYVGALCQGSLNDSVVGKSVETTWALFRPNPDPGLADGERFSSTRSFNFQSSTDLTTPNWGFVYDSQFTPTTLTFPSSNGFDCFETGDVVQSDWDQSAVWSNRVTCADGFAAGKGVTFGFDGDTSTECEMSATAFANQTPIVYTGTHSNVTSFSLTFAGKLYFNGSSDQAVDPDGNLTQNNGYYPIASVAAPSTITSIEIYPYGTAHAGGVRTIEINGKTIVDQGIPGAPGEAKVISKDEDANTITVDGGEWRRTDDVIYSNDLVSETGSYHNGRRPDRAFDGDLTTTSASENNGEYLEWTPTGGFDWTTSVELYVYQQEGSTQYNNDAAVAIPTLSGSEGWVTVKTGGGTINQVVLTGSPSDKAVVSAFRIDGVILFDPSGETKLVKETPYAAKLTVASSENLELLTGDVFMSDGSETPATQTPYKLVTTDIESVSTNSYSVAGGGNARANIGNIFDGDTSTNGECDIGTTNILFDEPISGVTKIEYNTSWNNNRVDASPANNHKLGYNANVNNDAIFYQNGSPTGWYTAYEGAPIDFTGVYFEVVNNGLNSQGCYAIRVNGTVLDLNNRVVLTFPGDVSTNPDLQYFKKGDVIQQTASLTMWRNQARQWDAGSKTGTKYRLDTSLLDSTGTTPMNFQEWLGAELNPADDIIDHYVFDDLNGAGENRASTNISPGYEDYSASEWFDRICKSASGDIKPYMGISYQSANNPGSDGDDLEIVGIAPVSVISTGYPDSNTMTVDGGDWGGEGTISYNSANGSNAIDPNNIFDGNENTFGTFTVDGSFIGFDSTGNNLRVKFILDKLHPDHKIYVQPKVNGGWTNSGTFDYNGLNYIDFDGVAAGTEIDTVFTMPDGYDGEARLSATGGNTLKDSTRISIYSSYSAGDTHVEYQTKGGQGDIVSVNTDDNTLLVTNSGDSDNRWIAENNAGTDFYVAPTDAVPISQDYAWGKLQIINNKAQVTGIQKDDPGYLPVPAKDYSIQFPALFPTGNEPDTDIPRGACIAAIVKAENSEGSDEKESNCFMPFDVNPDGAAGPITATTPTTLTVASSANLSDFSPGDNLVMVDENNDISDYTIVSDSIVSVAGQYSGSADVQPSVSGSWEQVLDGVVCNVPADCGFDTRNQTTWTFDNAITIGADDTFEIYNSGGSNYSNIVGWSYDNDPDNFTYVSGSAGIHGGGWGWDTLAVVGDLKKLRVGSSPGFSITAYRLNGKILDLGNQTLTFPGDVSTNPDLRYFKSGDVVQGAELGQKYNLYGTDLNETTLVDPSSISGWSENSLGSSNLTGNANILYADFGGSISPVFTRIDGGTGSDYTHQNLCYWNGTDWIVNATVSGGLSASNQLIATKSARYWAAFRNDSSLAIGSTVSSFSKANAGSHWSADVFGFSAPDDGAVKVISTGYPNSNTMVVDGGNWDVSNQSEVWSANTTGTPFDPNLGAVNAYDGNLSTLATAANGTQFETTFSPALTVNTSLRIYVQCQGDAAQTRDVKVNGVSKKALLGGNTANAPFWCDLQFTGELNTLTWTRASNGDNIALHAVEVDGKLLVDTGTDSGLGDNEVTYGPVTGTGTFQSADLAANTITMSVSNDRWIDNNNRLSKNFYVRDNITVLNADNPKHAAMQQAITAAFDAFPVNVQARNTAIASNFEALRNGQTLDAAELAELQAIVDAVTS